MIIPPEEQTEELAFLDGAAEKMEAIKNRLLEMKDIFASGFWEGLGDYKPVLNEISKDFQSIKRHLKDIFIDVYKRQLLDHFYYSIIRQKGNRK